MGKKELLDADLPPLDSWFEEPAPPAKWVVFSKRIFSVVKFLLGLCLLPLVYASSVSFFNELYKINRPVQDYFWAGAACFVAVYIFIYEPALIYRKGQRLLEIVFKFFAPMVRVAPYVMPVYAIIITAIYLLVALINKSEDLLYYYIFTLSFCASLHLVFTAKTMRSKKEDFLKANYLFGFSFIYVINLIILASFFTIIFKDYSFVSFFKDSFRLASDIFVTVFKQLFVVK